jgi:hypothetical protein
MYKYDVFISYRHGDPDRGVAIGLDKIFQKFDFDVAIDERVFSPQETALDEMARCVQESNYTIALLSKRYLESFYTLEEAVMQKCLDNNERKRRLIPVYIEPCDPPLWLQPLVGIRLYEKNSEPKPIEKLINTISKTAKSNKGLNEDKVQEKNQRTWGEISNKLLTAAGIGLVAYEIFSDIFSKDGIANVSAEIVEALKEQTADAGSDILKDAYDFFSDLF